MCADRLGRRARQLNLESARRRARFPTFLWHAPRVRATILARGATTLKGGLRLDANDNGPRREPAGTDESIDIHSPETLSALLGTSKRMLSKSNLDELLGLILNEATRLTHAARSTLYLVNRDAGELISYIAQQAEVHHIQLPLGTGIAGHVADTGEAMNLPDAYDCDLFDPEWDRRTGFRTGSVLCVPMRNAAGVVTGVIQVLNCERGVFDDHDRTALSMFASHAAAVLDNLRLHEDLRLAFSSAIRALAEAVDKRDPTTAGHSERVTYFSVKIAELMGLPQEEVTALEYAATLHDIGKLGIPDSILGRPDRLSDWEFGIMRTHALLTRDILSTCYFTAANSSIPFIAGAHHERLDGSGYPDGLSAEKIPIAVRILAVADVYDAITSFDRAYRKALSPEDARQILQETDSQQFDQDVVSTFFERELNIMERRRFVRVKLGLSIEYRILPRDRFAARDQPRGGRTRDIAGKGLLFVAEEFIPVGTFLSTRVLMKEETIEVLSKVVRADRSDRLGEFDTSIAFINLSRDAQHALQEHLVEVAARAP